MGKKLESKYLLSGLYNKYSKDGGIGKDYEPDCQRVDHTWPILMYHFTSLNLLRFLKDKRIDREELRNLCQIQTKAWRCHDFVHFMYKLCT